MWSVCSCAKWNKPKFAIKQFPITFLNCTTFYISLFYYLKLCQLDLSFVLGFQLPLFSGHSFLSLAVGLWPTPNLDPMKTIVPGSFQPTSWKTQDHAARVIFSAFLFTHWLSSHPQFSCIWPFGGHFANSSFSNFKASSFQGERTALAFLTSVIAAAVQAREVIHLLAQGH